MRQKIVSHKEAQKDEVVYHTLKVVLRWVFRFHEVEVQKLTNQLQVQKLELHIYPLCVVFVLHLLLIFDRLCRSAIYKVMSFLVTWRAEFLSRSHYHFSDNVEPRFMSR